MKKILAIDDQKDNLIIIKAVIGNNIPNCTVITALSGQEGIDMAIEEKPDAILLDIIMPDMDGYETCKILKQNTNTKHIPIIMITAIRTDSESRIKGLDLGADAFLSKPIDAIEFTAQVNVMLRIKEAEDKLRDEKEELEELVEKRTFALKESEKKYKALFEFAPLPYQSINEDGIINNVNPAWLQALGYKKDEIIGKYFGDFLHPTSTNHFKEIFPLFKKLGSVSDIQFKIQHKNNSYREISFDGRIDYHTDGSFKQTYCVFQDITEKKCTEKENIKLSTAVQQSPSVIVITNLEGKIEYVNPKFSELTGYSPKESIGQHTSLLKSGEQDIDIYKELWETVISGKNWHGIFHNKKKNGELFWEKASISPILDEQGKIINFLKVAEDITEIQTTEDELVRSEAKFKSLMQQSPFVVEIYNLDGLQISVNKAYEELWGFPAAETLYKFNVLQSKEVEDTGLMTYVKRAYNGESVSVPEYTFDSTGNTEAKGLGRARWLNTKIYPLKGEQGVVKNIVIVHQDVTVRRHGEQVQKVLFNISNAANTSDTLKNLINTIQYELGTLIDTTNFYVALYNSKNNTISSPYMTDEKDSFTDFPAGKTLTYYVIKTAKPLLATPEKLLELENLGEIEGIGSPSKIWLGVPLKIEGKVIGVYAVQSYTDENAYTNSDMEMLEFIADQISITINRKNIEAQQKESEERFRRLFEHLGDAVFVTGTELSGPGKILQVNAAAAQQTGYSKEELLQMNIITDLYVSGSGKMKLDEWHESLANGEVISTVEKKKHKDGSEYWTEVIVTPIEYKGIKAGLSINHDITKRINAEIKLKTALAKAEESDRLKSSFLANMSHEIRTPMNGIIGFTTLLREPDLTPDDIEEYVSVIERSGDRLLNTISDLMDISEIEAGQVNIRVSEVHIESLLDSLQAFFQLETKNKGLQLIMNIPDNNNSIKLLTDYEKLYGIFTNLIKNAIKFTKEGSVEFGYTEHKEQVEFYVKDTGIGIPLERQQVIFDRFIQADMKLSSNYEGTGLGLSIAKAYAEILGGKIWLESELEKGSTFYFTLS